MRFDPVRLFADPLYAVYAAAAVAAVEAGSVSGLSKVLEKDPSEGRVMSAAFAISTQGLTTLVARCNGIESLPRPLAEFLFEETFRADARAERLRTTLEETVHSLRAVGVEVVALKGAALAFFHYPAPALRPMGDLDLLLREPHDLARATKVLRDAGWRALLDTPRHRVFARLDERVARPASEDPDNPIRVEIHTSFRLPVLGCVYDASAQLLAEAKAHDLGGTSVAVAAGPSLLRHILFHAAEDFAGNGIRGIQAHDFRLLSVASGTLTPELSSSETGRGAAPLLYAADAIQRHFPSTFTDVFLETLASRTGASARVRAAALPSLRYTRPARGWTRTLLSLVNGPLPRTRFLLHTLFPTLGEVKANIAPDATGLALVAAWIRVLLKRVGLRTPEGPR